VLVLSPLFAPDLLAGYAFSSFPVPGVNAPTGSEWFYLLLMVLKFAPAGVLVRLCAPPAPLSAEALHCLSLSPATRQQTGSGALPGAVHFRGRYWLQRLLRGPERVALPIVGIVFLLAFQEFELASLLSIESWTVQLFDAQAQGLQPAATLQRLLVPAGLLLLIPLVVVLGKVGAGRDSTPRWRMPDTQAIRASRFALPAMVLSSSLLWGWPVLRVSADGMASLPSFFSNSTLVKSCLLDLTAALLLTGCCTVLAMSLAAATRWWRLSGCLLLPGLAGALAVSLAVLLIIQTEWLTGLRSTVIPAALALVLFLAPRAFLLRLLSPSSTDRESVHLAVLLNRSQDRRPASQQLFWELTVRHEVWLFATLFFMGLMNLTVVSILWPSGLKLLPGTMTVVPLPVRLYNLMHYGRSGPLSVMAVLSVLIPLLIAGMLLLGGPQALLRLALLCRRQDPAGSRPGRQNMQASTMQPFRSEKSFAMSEATANSGEYERGGIPGPDSSSHSAEPIWQLDQVCLSGLERPRLDSLSLSIHPGFTAVLGCSGSGKSSLLSLLAGFERADSGRITALRTSGQLPLFWSPQDHGLWPHLTVLEHIQRVRPSGPERQSLSDEQWLSLFRLHELAAVRPDRLSQGERSRLALVRALASEAQVLLLDEPLVHVDPVHSLDDFRTLHGLVRSRNGSVIFSAHDPQLVLRFADRVLCLRNGKLVFAGPVDQLYFQPPDRELAWMLGPANWISATGRPSEWRDWPECIRPDELRLQPASDGDFELIRAWNSGLTHEVELAETGSSKPLLRFFLSGPVEPASRYRLTFTGNSRRRSCSSG
jgi:ABC-type multidrug transport system ATPase subunit